MTTKILFPTFEVTLWNDEGEATKQLIVRAAPLNMVGQIKDLQIKLYEEFEKKGGSLGELLSDSIVIEHIKKIAGLVQVIGQKEPGFDIDNLINAGDIVQLGQIFFSEAVSADMRSPGWEVVEREGQTIRLYQYPEHRQNPTPSAIARIHDLNFFQMLNKARESILDQEVAEVSQVQETQEKTKAPEQRKESSKLAATPS